MSSPIQSVWFSGIWDIHRAVHPLPLSSSRTFHPPKQSVPGSTAPPLGSHQPTTCLRLRLLGTRPRSRVSRVACVSGVSRSMCSGPVHVERMAAGGSPCAWPSPPPSPCPFLCMGRGPDEIHTQASCVGSGSGPSSLGASTPAGRRVPASPWAGPINCPALPPSQGNRTTFQSRKQGPDRPLPRSSCGSRGPQG